MDGFTIDNIASANNATRGIVITNGASPTIKSCTIQGNSALNYVVGAGIYIDNGGMTLDSSYVGVEGAGNSGGDGGGLYVKTSSGGPYAVSINNSTISYNVGKNGGGVKFDATFNGMVNISGSTISYNQGASNYGAGLYSAVAMTITDSHIGDNLDTTATNYCYGGGMYLTGTDKVTTFSGGSITGNNASNGGGVYIAGGADLTIDGGAVVSGNIGDSATGAGVKIDGDGSSLTCSGVSFQGNDTSTYGGAIYNNGGSLTLTNCNVTGNTADGQSYSRGGGIYTTGSTATVAIYSSTIAGNYAAYGGGGFYHNGGITTATNSIFWDNTAATVSPEIYGTISATYCDIEGV